MLREPRSMVVFWDVRQGKPPRQLQSLLLDDEVGEASTATQTFCYQNVHFVSAFRYTAETETGA